MADTTHNIRIRMDTSGVIAGVAATRAGLQQVDAAATQASTRVGLLGRAFGGLQAQLTSLTGALGGFTAGFAALAAIRTLSNFDDQMATVRAVTLASAEDFKRLRDTALEFGSSTRFSATEAAAGLEVLGRAGASAEDSMKLLATTLQLSQAENLTLADSAETIVKVLAGMRLGMDQADRVANILSATASKTTTDVKELAVAFRYGSASAAGFKVPLETIAAALGVLAQNAQTGSLGGTALRGFLSRLAAPTKDFLKDLKGLGIQYDQINPKFVGFTDILKRFQKASIDASDSFKLFNQRSGSVVEILVNNIPYLERLNAELDGVSGLLQQKFEIKADTLAFDLLRVLAGVNALIIALGDAGLTAILRSVSQVIGATFRGAAAIVRELAPIVYNVGIAFAVAFAPQIVALFAARIALLTPLFVALVAQIYRAAAAMVVLAATNPITALIVGATLGITLLQQYGSQIGVLGTQYATVGDVFQAIGNRIASGFTVVSTAAADAFGAVGNFASRAANVMVTVFEGAINVVIALLQSVVDRITLVINSLGALTGLGEVGRIDLGKIALPKFETPDFIKGILQDADNLAIDRGRKSRADMVSALHDQALAAGGAAEATTRLAAAEDTEEGSARALRTARQDLLKDLIGPASEALGKMAALNQLFLQGQVNASEYADQLQRLRDTLLTNDQTFSGGMLKGLNSVAEGVTRLGDNISRTVAGAFDAASNAVADFAVTGKLSFQDLANSILRDMARLASNAIFGALANSLLGGFGGGQIGGAGLLGGGGGIFGGLGKLFGFASGGSAMVKGSGGTDSQLVSFWATPRERFDVLTPQQQRQQGGGGDGRNVTVNVVAPPGTRVDQTRQSRDAGGNLTVDVLLSAVDQAMAGGRFDKTMGARIGQPLRGGLIPRSG